MILGAQETFSEPRLTFGAKPVALLLEEKRPSLPDSLSLSLSLSSCNTETALEGLRAWGEKSFRI